MLNQQKTFSEKSNQQSVAIIGLGNQGLCHFAAAKRLKEEGSIDSIAVCDIDQQRLNSCGADFAFNAIDELLDTVPCNLAIITLPNDIHCSTVERALQAGAHVLKEKPLAICKNDLDRLLLASKKFQRRVIVAQQRIFHPTYALAKNWLESIGNVRLFDYTFCLNDQRNSWYWSAHKGGGCWFGLGWHACWMVQNFLGVIPRLSLKTLSGKQRAWPYDTDDTCIVHGVTDSGAAIRCLLSVSSPAKKEELIIEGSNGTIVFTRSHLSRFSASGELLEQVENTDKTEDLYTRQLRQALSDVAIESSGVDALAIEIFKSQMSALSPKYTRQAPKEKTIQIFLEHNLEQGEIYANR